MKHQINIFFTCGVLLVFVNLLRMGCADKILVHDCGSQMGKVSEVHVTGCNEEDKQCILKRNTNATISIHFIADKDSDDLNVVVHGIVLDIPTPFSMPNPDACIDSGIECPIKAGNAYEFITSLPVLKSYPKVSVDIKFQLQTAVGDFACIIIPAKLH